MNEQQDPYLVGQEQAIKAIEKLKLTGPMAASISAAEYRRSYNDIIKYAVKVVRYNNE